MISRPNLVDGMARILRVAPAQFARYADAAARSGFIPMPVMGARQTPLTSEQIGYLVLCAAASGPLKVPGILQALGSLRGSEGGSLPADLGLTIVETAKAFKASRPGELYIPDDWELVISLQPPWARVSYTDHTGRHSYDYGDPTQDGPAITQLQRFSRGMLLTAIYVVLLKSEAPEAATSGAVSQKVRLNFRVPPVRGSDLHLATEDSQRGYSYPPKAA